MAVTFNLRNKIIMSAISRTFVNKSKYTLTRRGKKLSLYEDSKFITALPKDVPERTW